MANEIPIMVHEAQKLEAFEPKDTVRFPKGQKMCLWSWFGKEMKVISSIFLLRRRIWPKSWEVDHCYKIYIVEL